MQLLTRGAVARPEQSYPSQSKEAPIGLLLAAGPLVSGLMSLTNSPAAPSDIVGELVQVSMTYTNSLRPTTDSSLKVPTTDANPMVAYSDTDLHVGEEL